MALRISVPTAQYSPRAAPALRRAGSSADCLAALVFRLRRLQAVVRTQRDECGRRHMMPFVHRAVTAIEREGEQALVSADKDDSVGNGGRRKICQPVCDS